MKSSTQFFRNHAQIEFYQCKKTTECNSNILGEGYSFHEYNKQTLKIDDLKNEHNQF